MSAKALIPETFLSGLTASTRFTVAKVAERGEACPSEINTLLAIRTIQRTAA
jgi:hypothetical protein